MNMSYCRFQNTLQDLEDCAEHINDNLTGDEYHARRRLIELCREILDEVEDVEFDERSDYEYEDDEPEITPYVPPAPVVYTHDDLHQACREGRKIDAIKAYRQLYATDDYVPSLLESKNAVEKIMETLP